MELKIVGLGDSGRDNVIYCFQDWTLITDHYEGEEGTVVLKIY